MKTNLSTYKMIINSEDRCVAQAAIEEELLDPQAVEIFLTSAGIKIGKLDETTAQAYARKTTQASERGELKVRFDCDLEGCTRTDLNNMYQDYLSYYCGVSSFTALTTTEDDQLWYAFFPDTKYTCEAIKGLPQLNGSKKYQDRANAIRRRVMSELLILGDLFNLLSSSPHNGSIDANTCDKLPADARKLIEKASVHICQTFEALRTVMDTHGWISKESSKYDIDWLKKETNLDFLRPESIKFTKIGISSMKSNREILFNLTYSKSM